MQYIDTALSLLVINVLMLFRRYLYTAANTLIQRYPHLSCCLLMYLMLFRCYLCTAANTLIQRYPCLRCWLLM